MKWIVGRNIVAVTQLMVWQDDLNTSVINLVSMNYFLMENLDLPTFRNE